MEPTILYRCDAHSCGNQVYVALYSFPVTKRTASGYWIEVYGRKRWVSATSKKRFAYPTREEAATSYKARKKRQIELLQADLNLARQCLEVDPKDYLDYTKPLVLDPICL